MPGEDLPLDGSRELIGEWRGIDGNEVLTVIFERDGMGKSFQAEREEDFEWVVRKDYLIMNSSNLGEYKVQYRFNDPNELILDDPGANLLTLFRQEKTSPPLRVVESWVEYCQGGDTTSAKEMLESGADETPSFFLIRSWSEYINKIFRDSPITTILTTDELVGKTARITLILFSQDSNLEEKRIKIVVGRQGRKWKITEIYAE